MTNVNDVIMGVGAVSISTGVGLKVTGWHDLPLVNVLSNESGATRSQHQQHHKADRRSNAIPVVAALHDAVTNFYSCCRATEVRRGLKG